MTDQIEDEKRVPSAVIILRTEDGAANMVASEGVDLKDYRFLRSKFVTGRNTAIDEWAHKSVFDQWCGIMMGELFEKASYDSSAPEQTG